jgi:ATP-dependent DNA helicase PIF1
MSTEDAANLHNGTEISIGSRIMVMESIWVEHGLNGAFGTVRNIIWKYGIVGPHQEPSHTHLVHFDR